MAKVAFITKKGNFVGSVFPQLNTDCYKKAIGQTGKECGSKF
jgi:hypothetical protein